MKISVLGQGYVGLPLSLMAASAGHYVFGIDSNYQKIEAIKKGNSYIEDISDKELYEALESGNFVPSSDFSNIRDSNIIVVCVPTPLDKKRKPDLSYLVNATSEIGRNLKSGTLVIFESTIEPGTTRNILLPLLIKESGLKASDFDLAFSPERVDPTNKNWSIRNTPKIVSGFTEKAANEAKKFYDSFIESTHICTSLEVAETAKLLENSFRLVNISLINEIAIYCNKIGINVGEVVNVAATKPYGFMPFYPSLGAGGHCIPVDPVYFSHAAKREGVSASLVDLAVEINLKMSDYFVARAIEMTGGLKKKRVLVIGVAYKPNISDVRDTPAESLISKLRSEGAEVSWHDDLVRDWNGEKSIDLKPGFDLAIIASPHAYLDLKKLGDTLVLDTRGSN
jgi:UDP-N-acetyl-D-glucosamine dehydrogenase